MDIRDYRQMISSKVLGNVEGMIGNLPQPTMFGGKRQRDFVLPGSTEYDYPASLAVGHLDTSGMPRTLGGNFWEDFGETEFLDEDVENEPQIGGKVKVGKALKKVGKALKPIGKELGRASKEVFRDVIVPEGKEALREYIRSLSSQGEMMGEGVNRRKPPPYGIRKQSKPQRPSDKVASMIGKDYSSFSSNKVKNASKWIQQHYPPPPAPKKRGRKPKKAPIEFIIEDDEEMEITPAPKKRGRKPKKGGVLIRNEPSQFQPSVYPPALDSYTPGHDAYGRGRGGKIKVGKVMKKVGKALKPFAPVAKDLALELAKEGLMAVAMGAGKPKKSSGRGAIVKEVMKKYGLSLPEASKFVKENNLY